MSNIGYMKYDTYKDICNAVREKTKEDNLYLASELPEKIRNIKSGGGFDFISESRDYNFTNDNPHPTVNITTQNNEAYFIYDNRDRKAWASIRFTLPTTKDRVTVTKGHLDANGEYVEDAEVNSYSTNQTIAFTFDLDYDYTVLKATGSITSWLTYYSVTFNGVSLGAASVRLQPMIECIADLPTYVGVNSTNTTNSYQLGCMVKKVTLKNMSPKYLGNLCNGCFVLTEFNVVNCDFSQLISMYGLFYNCASLKSFDFSGWNIGDSLTNLTYCFAYCRSLDGVHLNGINSHSITSLSNMFVSCNSLKEIDLSPLDTSKVTNIASLFSGCDSLKEIDLSNNTFGKLTTATNIFNNCYSLKSLKLPDLDLSECTTLASIFYNCKSLIFDDDLADKISRWSINKCTSLLSAFYGCQNLLNIDISKWDISNVTTLQTMFYACYSLLTVKLPKSEFKATLNTMFYLCYSLRNIDLSGLNCTTTTDCYGLFNSCYSLENVILPTNLKPSNMNNMFVNCHSLKTIENLNTIDTTNCVSFNSTFNTCSTLKSIDLSNFTITDKCTNMGSMFRYCFNLEEVVFNPDLAHDTSKVTAIEYFINQCYNLKKFEFKIPLQNITNARELAQEDFNLKYIDTLISLDKITSYPPTYSNCVSLEYANYSSQPNIAYNLSVATNLSREYLLDVINKLPNLSTAKTLTLGQHRLKLTDAELQVAINKNWTIA